MKLLMIIGNSPAVHLSFTRYLPMLFYPIRKDRQSHDQILTIDDQILTVLDFLDSHLTRTTLLMAETGGLVDPNNPVLQQQPSPHPSLTCTPTSGYGLCGQGAHNLR